MKNNVLSAYQRVRLARSEDRPRAKDYIEELFDDIVYLNGDRHFGNSQSVIGGIASFQNQPVTFIGIQKGRGIEEAVMTDFGMPKPEGYRKAMRLMESAAKFGRPVITFVDTPGAYPGVDAEERGQSEAIASSLALMSGLEVPVIAFIIGEGGSGGALALSVANRLYMLENAVFSILSPEGFASILWKDSSLASDAAELMKLTAFDLKEAGIIDGIIKEEQHVSLPALEGMKATLTKDLKQLKSKKGSVLRDERYDKFRAIGG
ncbi:MAG: acetyl-CoA carboxylase carboxyltransferase subunit alpha [Bacillota bacterium]|nr:acetyl-CoA carboxylase carboxyltransferase subunit alpha [Bacillota bacterium]